MKQNLNAHPLALAKNSHLYKIPLLGEYGVHAFAKGTIDVNSFLVGSSGATSFVFGVTTNGFVRDGIMRGDQLLVDTDLIAANGDLIIAAIDHQYQLMRLSDVEKVDVWAVVTGVIRKLATNTA
jgi:SOS-response transcriptional repressor LexA